LRLAASPTGCCTPSRNERLSGARRRRPGRALARARTSSDST
jgi:hypothetical protein